jgi:hypothetical protein
MLRPSTMPTDSTLCAGSQSATPVSSSGARTGLAGFAERLVASGAPAAMLWPDGADAARSRRRCAAWRDGLDWPALARLDGASFEHAGQLAAGAASGTTDAHHPGAAAAALPTPPRHRHTAPQASSPVLPPPAPPSREAIAERLLETKRAEGRFDVFLCHNSAGCRP